MAWVRSTASSGSASWAWEHAVHQDKAYKNVIKCLVVSETASYTNKHPKPEGVVSYSILATADDAETGNQCPLF